MVSSPTCKRSKSSDSMTGPMTMAAQKFDPGPYGRPGSAKFGTLDDNDDEDDERRKEK